MSEYKKYRKHSKIYELPKKVKDELDDKLNDTSLSYTEITLWINKKGYEIGRSTIGRYALETRKLSNKLIETREQVKELVKLAKDNTEENITEGALQLATYKLTEKIAMVDDEIDEMDIGEAVKLVTAISRTKAYKDKIYANLKSDYEKAYEQFNRNLQAELKAYPELIERLQEIANETLGKVTP